MENKILAVVNGKEITTNDIQLLMNSLGPQRAQQFQNEQGQKVLLDELINQTLFLEDAKDQKLEETEAFQKELAIVKENVLKQMNINNLMSEAKVTEEEVKSYYDANKSQFVTQEKANASHILVDSEEKCQEIIDDVKDGKITFEDAAKEYSKCPSKDNGGNLGTFERGKMVPEFEEVTFDMKVDEISNPVKTQFGFHAIKLNSLSKKAEMSFEDSKQHILTQLTKDKQKQLYMDKVANLKEKYTVEVK